MTDMQEFRENMEQALYGPAPDLRIYAVAKKPGRSRYVPPDYDSGFLAAMSAVGVRE